MLDLTGQRVGFVEVIGRTNERKRQSVVWKCICDCGNTCYFSAKELKEVKSKSCGCKNSFAKDLKGQIFGRLEVLEMTDERQLHGQGAHVVWKCKCHGCGSVVKLSSRTLLINNATSCGCRGLKPGDAALNCLLTSYKKWAKEKGVEWGLTRKQANRLFKSNCHYCGAEPKNKSNSRSYKESYMYNGLDAVDNKKGYELSNVVPCCKKCNEVKAAMPLHEFESYMYILYDHYFIEEGWRNFSWDKESYLECHLFNQIIRNYENHANTKGVVWDLTERQVGALIFNNCHYCGAEPSNGIGNSKYSGLDAVDNLGGYTADNVVPCCLKCNRSKRAMSIKEWEEYISRVYNHYFKKIRSPLPMNGLLKNLKT